MDNPCMNRDQLDAMIDAYVTALSTSGKVGLFTNDFAPDSSNVFADFTVPTASWYTAATFVPGAVFQDGGMLRVVGAHVEFTYSGVDPAETVYGWLLYKETAGPVDTLITSYRLAVAKTMAGAYDGLIVEPNISVPLIEQS